MLARGWQEGLQGYAIIHTVEWDTRANQRFSEIIESIDVNVHRLRTTLPTDATSSRRRGKIDPLAKLEVAKEWDKMRAERKAEQDKSGDETDFSDSWNTPLALTPAARSRHRLAPPTLRTTEGLSDQHRQDAEEQGEEDLLISFHRNPAGDNSQVGPESAYFDRREREQEGRGRLLPKRRSQNLFPPSPRRRRRSREESAERDLQHALLPREPPEPEIDVPDPISGMLRSQPNPEFHAYLRETARANDAAAVARRRRNEERRKRRMASEGFHAVGEPRSAFSPDSSDIGQRTNENATTPRQTKPRVGEITPLLPGHPEPGDNSIPHELLRHVRETLLTRPPARNVREPLVTTPPAWNAAEAMSSDKGSETELTRQVLSGVRTPPLLFARRPEEVSYPTLPSTQSPSTQSPREQSPTLPTTPATPSRYRLRRRQLGLYTDIAGLATAEQIAISGAPVTPGRDELTSPQTVVPLRERQQSATLNSPTPISPFTNRPSVSDTASDPMARRPAILGAYPDVVGSPHALERFRPRLEVMIPNTPTGYTSHSTLRASASTPGRVRLGWDTSVLQVDADPFASPRARESIRPSRSTNFSYPRVPSGPPATNAPISYPHIASGPFVTERTTIYEALATGQMSSGTRQTPSRQRLHGPRSASMQSPGQAMGEVEGELGRERETGEAEAAGNGGERAESPKTREGEQMRMQARGDSLAE